MVRLTDRPDMTLDVYRGRKTTMQQQQQSIFLHFKKKMKERLDKDSAECYVAPALCLHIRN